MMDEVMGEIRAYAETTPVVAQRCQLGQVRGLAEGSGALSQVSLIAVSFQHFWLPTVFTYKKRVFSRDVTLDI